MMIRIKIKILSNDKNIYFSNNSDTLKIYSNVLTSKVKLMILRKIQINKYDSWIIIKPK